MALETGTYIADLVVTNPTASDPKSQGDDHIRLEKTAMRNSFAGFTGAVAVTGVDGGAVDAYTLTPATALPSYTSKTLVEFTPNATSTSTTPTLNISGLGAKTIVSQAGAALLAGDLVSGRTYLCAYDGTYMRLVSVTTAYVDAVRDYATSLAFTTALPAQPGGTTPYKLRTLAGVAGWVIEQMPRSTRVANSILAGADSNTVVDITAGTFAQTLTAAATLTNGWFCVVKNTGTGLVTLTPNGAELIDGAVTKVLQNGQVILLTCDGVGFYTTTLDDQTFDANSGLYYNSFFTQTSGSFTTKKTGWHRLTSAGAGGSGAVSMAASTAIPGKACGGAAGGLASKRVWLVAGATITFTIGAGGTATVRSTTGGSTNGTAGGTTTVVANGITLTGNGGAGGASSITGATVNGAVGGTATGGDINNQGGGSGNCIGLGQSATGGGCIGIGGPGKSSGTADSQVANSAAASGGAGTGGASGNATATTANFGSSTGGGGAAGDSAAVSSGATTSGAAGIGSSPPIFLPSNCSAAGSAGSTSGASAAVVTAGGGSGGGAAQGGVNSGNAVLGGTGGAADIGGAAAGLTNGTPGPGCGSGGISKCTNAVTNTVPAGGNGYALIEW